MSNTLKSLQDRDLEDYFQALFGLYGHPGWKKLMEDFARMKETHDTLSGVTTTEQLWFRQGQVNQMEFMIAHQAVNEAAYAQLIAEQEGTDEETPTGGVAKVVE